MEEAVSFGASGEALYGVLHLPDGAAAFDRMLLMVVGGPQTRVGSSRSYVLLARDLCAGGIPVFRFDYAGLGDSRGGWLGFTHAGPSIKAALSHLKGRFPSLREFALWSLCDGSAACALFPREEARAAGVKAMILCNPYVHSPEGEAKTILRHYYWDRIRDPEFWKKLFSGRLNPFAAAGSLLSLVKSASGGVAAAGASDESAGKSAQGLPGARGPKKGPAADRSGPGEDPDGLPDLVLDGISAFPGRLFLFLSTDDYTAREFEDLYRKRIGRRRQGEIDLRHVEGADHTFTSADAKRKICELTRGAWRSIGEAREVGR